MNHEASEAPRYRAGEQRGRSPRSSGGDSSSNHASHSQDTLGEPSPSPQTAPAPSASSSAGWVANLWQRLQSALVLIPIVVVFIFCGGWYAFVGGILALSLDIFELRSMFANKGWRPQMLVSVALSVDFLVAAMFPHQRTSIIFFGIGAAIIISFGSILRGSAPFEALLRDWALTLAIPFYLGWPLSLFLLVRGYDFGFGSRGFWWVLATCGMVWANDSAAYAVGHFFGRSRLAPRISPAKSWEGFFGGAVFSIIGAFVLTFPLHIPWYATLALGALVAIAATIGDLSESLIKRGTGVKDSGSIIPGHGGLLDRMDSLLFAVIVVASFATVIDKLL